MKRIPHVALPLTTQPVYVTASLCYDDDASFKKNFILWYDWQSYVLLIGSQPLYPLPRKKISLSFFGY